jgi:hypothetical protein
VQLLNESKEPCGKVPAGGVLVVYKGTYYVKHSGRTEKIVVRPLETVDVGGK